MNALVANRHNKKYEACWSCCSSSKNMFEKKKQHGSNGIGLDEAFIPAFKHMFLPEWLPFSRFHLLSLLLQMANGVLVFCCQSLTFSPAAKLSMFWACVFFFHSLHFFTWSIIQTRWFSLVYIAIVLGSYQKIYFCHVIHDETHKYMYLYILKYDICLRCDSIDSQCEFRIVAHPRLFAVLNEILLIWQQGNKNDLDILWI